MLWKISHSKAKAQMHRVRDTGLAKRDRKLTARTSGVGCFKAATRCEVSNKRKTDERKEGCKGTMRNNTAGDQSRQKDQVGDMWDWKLVGSYWSHTNSGGTSEFPAYSEANSSRICFRGRFGSFLFGFLFASKPFDSLLLGCSSFCLLFRFVLAISFELNKSKHEPLNPNGPQHTSWTDPPLKKLSETFESNFKLQENS